MKKVLSVVIAIFCCILVSACGENEVEKALNHTPSSINTSPDKYTWYVKDYVGKNAAAIGESDRYGDGWLKIVYVSNDGNFVTKEEFKEYVVIGQNIAPNSEIKYAFGKKDDGTESSWVEMQNIEQIELRVAKIPSEEKEENDEKQADKNQNKSEEQKSSSNAVINHTPQQINTSPDKYTWYVKDYVGQNLASFGYTSMGGERRDKYGDGTIKLVINTSDGSYIDINNKDELKNYTVASQSIAPNTEIKYTFDTYSDGKESSLVATQNIDEVQLNVIKTNN
ncbi:MAG: hypothetical protein ACI4DY_13785 [Monoglobaceae bacterium]